MIIPSYSNIDIIQGVIGYGNVSEGITDWRITNTNNGVFNILNSSSIIRPSGGTSVIGEIPGSTDRYMIFTAGTSTFTVPSGGIVCDILIVGGGGGGGFDGSGGGGGGEVKYYTNNITAFNTGAAYTLLEGTYTINVGTGGTAGVSVSSAGENGTISEIKNNLGTTLLSAGGGGGGGSRNTNGVSGVGGGGGAGHGSSYTGGSSTGSGGIGGNASSGLTGGGGAGGANVANKNGGNGSSTIAGTGGVGANISITGSSIGYGGGGAGGTYLGFPGGGPSTKVTGTQGGGNGGTYNDMPTSGTSNTGGGGGGGGNATSPNSSGTGGNGGSGIVIIRYSTANLSIIDNGNVGIGTIPITSSSKLEIIGDINISGNFKKNNRDVINDTSNYILSTSNILVGRITNDVGNGSNYVSRINTELNANINNTSNYVATTYNNLANRVSNSQWTNISSGIYYTAIPNPITSSPAATTTGITGNYTYMQFTYTTETAGAGTGQSLYTITVPTGGVMCDILIVGGGGGGGTNAGAGGGAGGLILLENTILSAGTITIKVGNGGDGGTTSAVGTVASNGKDTIFGTNTAIGGGAGVNSGGANGNAGGSGGGAGNDGTGNRTGGAGTTGQGFKGGNGTIPGGSERTGGGGGGAGGEGQASVSSSRAGDGGIGRNMSSIFGTSVGQTGWFAGGGGGGVHSGTGGTGGNGGGGSEDIQGTNGTGGGGGAGRSPNNGKKGGSGIVIIRYLQPTTNVGIGTTNPNSKLHLYDDVTTNTNVTIQNNYIDNVVISPATGYTVTETIENSKYYRTLSFAYNVSYPILTADVTSFPVPVLTTDEKNLIAWYKLEGNLIDSTGVTGSLTGYNGGLLYTQDTSIFSNLPYAYYTNHNIAANTNWALTPVINRNVPLTFAFWFRQTSASYSTIMGYGDKSVNGMGIQFDFYLTSGTSYQLTVYTALSNQWTIQPTATGLSLNTWYFCVYTLSNDTAVIANLYVNGVWRASGTGTSGQTLLHSKTLTIGQSGDGAARGFGGNLADIRIYNRVLSQDEINTLYNINTPSSIAYSIYFNKATSINVNSGAANTVQGLYNILLGPVNSSMVPMDGQLITPLTSTATTVVSIKYEFSIQETSLPNLITVTGATGVTSSVIGTTERLIMLPYTSDSSGLTGQTQYTFTTTEPLICDILIVGGGGGGGFSYAGGGGGGGGYVYLQKINLPVGNYTVNVGKGGIAGISGSGWGGNGANTSISGTINYVAIGGGGGAGGSFNGTIIAIGNNGGSGGGGSYSGSQIIRAGGTSTQVSTYGYGSGGNGNSYVSQIGGGGGGASGTTTAGSGTGNNGLSNSITGYNITYAGGGGGGTDFATVPQGGAGGGGSGGNGTGTIISSSSGINGLGGGGGGARGGAAGAAGNGGSGIFILRYRKFPSQSSSLELISGVKLSEVSIPRTIITTVPNTSDRCILFPYTGKSIGTIDQTQYNFTTTEELNCDILVVGGGGCGGRSGGGGGCVIYSNIILIAGKYTVNVGNGGIAMITGDVSNTQGVNGVDSEILLNSTTIFRAKGGGFGAANGTSTGNSTTGGTGGSGGGSELAGIFSSVSTSNIISTYNYTSLYTTLTNQSPNGLTIYGNIGGAGFISNTNYCGGGGGGAGGAGGNGNSLTSGNGGLGINNNITGVNIMYGAGGSGGVYNQAFDSSMLTSGSVSSGGGRGAYNTSSTGKVIAGTTISGTGAGGGGWSFSSAGTPNSIYPSDGASGIVIIRYRRSIDNTLSYKVGNYDGDFKIISSSSSIDTDYMRITSSGASIYNATGSPQWSTVSDKRIKENIEKASYDICYNNINKLELYRFNYIKELNNINKDIKQLGYIAQEVQDIFPKAVSSQEFHNDNLSIPEMLSIDVTQINYSLYGAVKKLIEIDKNKELRIQMIENLLNIDNTNNITLEDSLMSSNIILEDSLMSSNIILEDSLMSSNITLEDSLMSSNITLEDSLMSSNQAII